MRNLKSFGTFIGESNVSELEQDFLLNMANEADILPGVSLNPSSSPSAGGLKNNFYVIANPDEVRFVGLQKDSDPAKPEVVEMVFRKTPVQLGGGNYRGKVAAYLCRQPLTKTGKEGNTQYLDDYTVKAENVESLTTADVASGILGAFLFASGTYISDSSFKNVLTTIVKLKRGDKKASENPTFIAFTEGILRASERQSAFLNIKDKSIGSKLVQAKRGGKDFKVALDEIRKKA